LFVFVMAATSDAYPHNPYAPSPRGLAPVHAPIRAKATGYGSNRPRIESSPAPIA
jgi:hypothetical protein